jgi:hypothetical protein
VLLILAAAAQLSLRTPSMQTGSEFTRINFARDTLTRSLDVRASDGWVALMLRGIRNTNSKNPSPSEAELAD